MDFIKGLYKKIDIDKLIYFLIAIGIIIRCAYVMHMPFFLGRYNHDQHGYEHGHIEYIVYIYQNEKLPNDNYYTFSHPPFFHILSVLWMKAISLFNSDINFLLDSLHLLSLIISIFIMIVWKRILDEFNMQPICKIFLFSSVALNSYFIIFSGFTNNDPLSLLLSLLSILYLIKWYKKQTFNNIIIMALYTGLAVMTKISSGLIAFPIGVVFFEKLLKKDTEYKKLLVQLICFGLISLSLGMWYPIRNKILFNQPILYVFDTENEDLYIGNENLFQRLFSISADISFEYACPQKATNMPIYLFKTSLFDEFNYDMNMTSIYMFSLVFHIVAILFELYLILKIKQKNKKNLLFISSCCILMVNIILYIVMNIKLPYSCSMDFRYVIFAWLANIILATYSVNIEYEEKKDCLIYILILENLAYMLADVLIFKI